MRAKRVEPKLIVSNVDEGCRACIKLTSICRRTQLESWSIEGETPVVETVKSGEHVPEYYGTLEIL